MSGLLSNFAENFNTYEKVTLRYYIMFIPCFM